MLWGTLLNPVIVIAEMLDCTSALNTNAKVAHVFLVFRLAWLALFRNAAAEQDESELDRSRNCYRRLLQYQLHGFSRLFTA